MGVGRSVVLRLDDFLATIVAIRAHVVAQMNFAGAWLDSQGQRVQEVMRTVHATLGRRFLVLLNCHDYSRKILRILTQLDVTAIPDRSASDVHPAHRAT
jgi:hypothetical protein